LHKVKKQGRKNMKQILLIASGLIILGIVAVIASPATAMNGSGSGYPPIPSWSQTLQGNWRFVVLINMNGEAVLDKETGLVWEKSPSTNGFNWVEAQAHCNQLATGGRLGWRLPTIQELASLINPSSLPGPTLPTGHPFSNVQPSFYWSATTLAVNNDGAWVVQFINGSVGSFVKSDVIYSWCVRGGSGVDLQ
jgi:hypothetical protein